MTSPTPASRQPGSTGAGVAVGPGDDGAHAPGDPGHDAAGGGGRLAARVAGIVAAHPMLRHTEREARVWARAFRGAAITGILTPVLFLGAMGVGLGGLIDDNTGDVEGLSYLVFVTPGIMAAAALQSGAGDALWPVLGGLKWSKTFQAAAATPLRPADVYRGYMLWVAIKMTLNAIVFLVIAALLGGIPSAWGLLAVPAAVAGGMAFAAPLAVYSARQENDMGFSLVMRIGVMPMFLFSGTFFAVDQLPAGVRPLAWLTPLWHAVELCRGATTASLDLLPAVGHVAYLAAGIAIGVWLGGRAFTRRLTP